MGTSTELTVVMTKEKLLTQLHSSPKRLSVFSVDVQLEPGLQHRKTSFLITQINKPVQDWVCQYVSPKYPQHFLQRTFHEVTYLKRIKPIADINRKHGQLRRESSLNKEWIVYSMCPHESRRNGATNHVANSCYIELLKFRGNKLITRLQNHRPYHNKVTVDSLGI